jgi:YVTN family beta-propeller protein
VATIAAPKAFGFAFGNDGTIWLGGGQTGLVRRMDPATNKVVATVKINDPSKAPGLVDAGIVPVITGSGEVWALDRTNREAVRIDPRTNRIVNRLPLGIEPGGGAISAQTFWVTTAEDEPAANTVVKIDLRSEKVVARITNAKTSLGELYVPPTAGPDALWFVDWSRGLVKRLDAVTNKVVTTVKTPDPQPAAAVADGQTVWVTSHYLNLVTRIDARTNMVTASIPLTGYPSGTLGTDCCFGVLAEGGGAVWTIAGSGSRTLVRIDPQTNRVTASLTFSQAIWFVAFVNGSVWVEAPDKFYRIDPAAMIGS